MNLFQDLQVKMSRADYLSARTNPVLVKLQDQELLVGALQQYSVLPRVIVTLLADGLYAVNGWHDVEEDIRENIADETGRRTGGVAHYTILRRALHRETGVRIDGVKASDATMSFITMLRNGLLTGSRPFAAGILWGLEATAVPELAVVAEAINQIIVLGGETPVIELKASAVEAVVDWNELSLTQFFRLHIAEFEIDHRDGLRDAVLKYLNIDTELPDFRAGVELVLDEMREWWKALASNG